MKNILLFILFLLGFIIIGLEGENIFSNLGIDIPYLNYIEEKKSQKFIGGLFCIISFVLFRMIRSSKIKKEQERQKIENDNYNNWFNNLSEEERVEIEYKKWIENTIPILQKQIKIDLAIQDSENSLIKYSDDEEKSNYKYRKLTPLEERILYGSKEEREKDEAEAAIRAQERKVAEQKRKADLSRRFKSDEVDKILQKILWLGMTEEMLFEVKGEPSDTSENVSGGKIKKKYFYGKKKNRVGNDSFDFEVSLENDIITGWKDRINRGTRDF